MLFRSLKFSIAVALALGLLSTSALADSWESQGFQVEHNVPIEAVAGQDLHIAVSLEPASSINYAALYYRQQQERVFKPIVMRKTGRNFMAIVPGKRVAGVEIKYYVRVTNKLGDNLYLVGSPRSPKVVAVAEPQIQKEEPTFDFDLSSLDSLESEFEMLAAEDIIVSAAKRQQKISEAPSAVFIITAQDIEAYGYTTFADLLRYAPGMDVYRVNDGNAILGVRGFADEANNLVLVLIDGRQVNVELFGSPFLDNLPITLAEIERIEIVRGPGSTLYGANAFSGIVNVITRKPANDEAVGNAFVAYDARFRTAVGEAYASGVSGPIGYRVSGAYRSAGSYGDSSTRATEHYMIRGVMTSDKLGFLHVDAGFTAQDSEQFTVMGENPTRMSMAHARLDWNYEDITLQGAWSMWQGELFASDRFFESLIPVLKLRTNTGDLELRYSHFWDPYYQLTLGANMRANTFDSDALSVTNSTETRAGVFIQNEISPVPEMNINLGFRSDFSTFYLPNESFGKRLTYSPRGSVVYSLKEGHTLRINGGMAFRKPSFFEQKLTLTALDSVAANFANPDLKNERIASIEGGYIFDALQGLRVQLDGYYYRLRDLIEYDAGKGNYQNLSDANAWGAEASFKYLVNLNWSVYGNYSFMQTTNLEKNPLAASHDDPCAVGLARQLGPDDPALCPVSSNRNPAHKANAGARANYGDWFLSANVGFVHKRVYYLIDPTQGGLIFPTRQNQTLDWYINSSAKVAYRVKSGPIQIGLLAEQLQFDDHREFPGLDPITPSQGAGLPERTTNYGGEPLGGKVFAFVEATF